MPNTTLRVWTRCKARGKIDFYAPITNDFYYETDAYQELDRIYGLKDFAVSHKYASLKSSYYFMIIGLPIFLGMILSLSLWTILSRCLKRKEVEG